MKFGEILQQLMEDNNITPKQLARHLCISITVLNSYTRCVSEPNFATLKRIAVFFEVRIDDLLDYRGMPNKSEYQMEDELLQAFSEMPPEQQRIFLEQGRAAVRVVMQK